MGVFDKMLDERYRFAFLQKKENKLGVDEEYLSELRAYILSDSCFEDIRKLQDGDYFIDVPVQHMIRKNHSVKRRKVYNFRGRGKFLLQYMAFVLMDYDDIHSESLCSFRRDNRTREFFRKLRGIDPNRELYVMQTDIHDCGGSVDQDVLLEIVSPLFSEDPDFLSFLRWIMTRNQFYRDGRLVNERVSVIEGLPIGQFLLNVYLDSVDRALEPMSRLYIRYTDDISFFTDDLSKAREALELVRKLIDPLKLTLNEKKTHIIPPHEKVELLGIELYPGGFDIGEDSMRKLLSKLKRKRDRLLRLIRRKGFSKERALLEMIKYYDRAFFGFKAEDHEFNWVIHAFPIITRTDGLERIDAYAQDCIRVAGSGKLGKARYRITYKKMIEAGYRGLVSSYYHGYTIREREWHANSADNADSNIG